MATNTNIKEIKEIISPELLLNNYKPNDDDKQFIEESRKTIEQILFNEDKRLLVIVGPCSIHDYTSALLEGCKKILEFDESLISATIASAKNECNLYYTIDRDVVKHNITTFSLF
jgi:phospho-2-dehydro-3-deoxyheptonate aldolase